jgi:hypothetical protein
MRIDYLLISFIVFTVVIIIGFNFMADVRHTYNKQEDANATYFKNSYNTIANMQDIAGNQYNSTFNPQNPTSPTDSVLSGAYNTVRFIGQIFPMLNGIAYDLATFIGLPNATFWVTVVIIVMTILILFSIIYLLITRYVSP